MTERDYRGISLWLDSVPGPLAPRAPLDADGEVDVAIAGAGFSGLWTAYYLKRLRPALRIAVLEAEIAGFGASGRNGGWCVGLLAGFENLLARPDRRERGLALQRALFDAVDEVGRVAATESIDCHFRKGGSVRIATSDGQMHAMREAFGSLAGYFGPEDFRWLDAGECDAHVRVAGNRGGFWFAHCAALHPGRLARGLAATVERMGVRVFERSPVTRIERGLLRTARGEVRAGVVVRATEAYTARLHGHERALVPLHSWMLATEPLPESTWKEIGLERAQTFGDGRGITTYGQRTADGRIAFGGLGHYRYGSGIEPAFPAEHPNFRALEGILRELLPQLGGARVTHRWGGALGVPRDSRPRVWLDRERGSAFLGGYIGEGVAASNLAGRTLAELIAGEESERTQLPWIAPPARDWESEPLRYLAVQGVLNLVAAADRAAASGKPPGWRGRLARALLGV